MSEVQIGRKGTQQTELSARNAVALRTTTHAGRAIGLGAVALGALALGATAIGALAIGRLAVGAFTMTRGRVRSLTVDNLDVRRLHVGELTIDRVVPSPAFRSSDDDSYRNIS
jgi:hypothetical protein